MANATTSEVLSETEAQALEARLGFRFQDELEPFLLVLGMDEPFFAVINRNCVKVRTREIQTAGVTVERSGAFKLLWNPDFVASLSRGEVRGLLIHEFMHLILEHVTLRRRQPHQLWNIATDLAINSLIKPELLPKCTLYPGPRPKELGPWQELKLPPGPEGSKQKPRREPTSEDRRLNDHMMKLLESFPPRETSDYYFERLLADPEIKEAMRSGIGELIIGDGTMDDHNAWDEVDEDIRDMIREQLRDLIEQGVKACDTRNQWGSVPHEMQQVLRDMVAGQVDWRALLRQFVGQSISCERTNSIKKINRKYPYVHPGSKRKHRSRVLVAIDQSGSVGDDNIEEMFGELNNLARIVDFTVMPFDTEIGVNDRLDWKRGQRKPTLRFRSGGTDFNAPTRFFNDHRGEWDALIIFSDGECSKPDPIVHGRRAYVIVPGRKLLFEPDDSDLVIQMTVDKRKPA